MGRGQLILLLVLVTLVTRAGIEFMEMDVGPGLAAIPAVIVLILVRLVSIEGGENDE